MNVCPNCNEDYDSLGIHWNYCGHPELSNEKVDIIVGLLLSDGTLTKGNGRPQFTVYNTNKKFLDWVNKNLSFLSNSVRLFETGEEKHERNIKIGFDSNRESNYKDIYCMTTVSHPINTKLYSWYDSGKKVYPEDLKLTPTIAKMWYCGDGNVNWDSHNRAYCEIGCSNERTNEEKIVNIFENAGFDVTFKSGRIRFYGNSKKFLNWMGSPPDGMRYKWQIKNRSSYDDLIKRKI